MATELPILVKGYKAASDLSAKQFFFVKFTGDQQVDLCAAVTDVPCGILQNKPTSGRTAEVLRIGISKVVAGGTLAAGDLVGTDGAGKAVKYTPGTDTTKYVAGSAEEAGAAAEISTVCINCVNVGRAA